MHACPRQTDRQTDKRTNIMAIARRFVLRNASRAKNRRSTIVKSTSVVPTLTVTLRVIYLAASEISELADIGQRHNHVGWFEIEVNNASSVQVTYSVCNVQSVPVVSTTH